MFHRFARPLGVLFLLTAPAVARAAAPQGAPGSEPAGSAVTPPPPQQADDATRAAARRIAEEGLKLFDGGRYADALDRFERAAAVVKAPTMKLMAARSLEKLGRLVEASERYLATAAIKLDEGASDAFRAAQVDAAKERAALLPRIPSLTIDIGAAPATVTLDGKALSAALVGGALPVDPGEHTVIVTRDGQARTERVTLKEGEARRLAFVDGAPPSGGSPLQTVGWVGLAAGGAGLVAGAIVGGILLSTKSRLDDAGCKDAECPAATTGDVDTYNSLRPVTTGVLTAGAVLAVAGGLTLIFAPSPTSPAKTGQGGLEQGLSRIGEAVHRPRERRVTGRFLTEVPMNVSTIAALCGLAFSLAATTSGCFFPAYGVGEDGGAGTTGTGGVTSMTGGAGGVSDCGGLATCGAECANLATDIFHCGQCDVFCDEGPCVAGQCTDCGALANCQTTCADLQTDDHHCGECGIDCGVGHCVAGSCEGVPGGKCAAPLVECEGVCVNLANDLANCGECSNACGGTCQNGSCYGGTANCAGSLVLCDATCVDLATDPANCGECGNACLGTCEDGSCTGVGSDCAVGFTKCGDVCVDTKTDPANCGECSLSCGAWMCTNGGCVASGQ